MLLLLFGCRCFLSPWVFFAEFLRYLYRCSVIDSLVSSVDVCATYSPVAGNECSPSADLSEDGHQYFSGTEAILYSYQDTDIFCSFYNRRLSWHRLGLGECMFWKVSRPFWEWVYAADEPICSTTQMVATDSCLPRSVDDQILLPWIECNRLHFTRLGCQCSCINNFQICNLSELREQYLRLVSKTEPLFVKVILKLRIAA